MVLPFLSNAKLLEPTAVTSFCWLCVRLVVVPFMFRGDAYNRTYMKISDLRTMYETVVRGDGAVYASLSYAAPLSYYYPQLGPRLRVITATAPSQPGWYVQRNESFDASRASVVIREGNTVAARIP